MTYGDLLREEEQEQQRDSTELLRQEGAGTAEPCLPTLAIPLCGEHSEHSYRSCFVRVTLKPGQEPLAESGGCHHCMETLRRTEGIVLKEFSN